MFIEISHDPRPVNQLTQFVCQRLDHVDNYTYTQVGPERFLAIGVSPGTMVAEILFTFGGAKIRMAKINEIQNRLRQLDGGSFQKLADAYLHKKGYDRINPLGSVVGADKVRRGTPDTFFPLTNGKYVFAEYTTQQDNVFEKLYGDLQKCFDEPKTGIPIGKIEELVFCHTSTLKAKEQQTLAEECQKRGVNLNIFGIGPISYDLYQKYPGLASEFLGLNVDTGQIVPPDEFVATYNKNRLAARLDTTFHFRDAEVDQALQGLEQSDLIIVFGRSGVGKSRLTLEVCNLFAQTHPGYQVFCVINRGPDLFEDLRIHFSEPGKFLILVDDANRTSRFEYIIQLLQGQRIDQQIKVVATVRDYALEKLRQTARPYDGPVEIELQPLEDSQIKQIIKNEFDIQNPHYLERIASIAQGNPRLAVMAAEIAKRQNTFQSISDVTGLYDEYFATIRSDLDDLRDQTLLKVGGILAFFRTVDRSNDKMMAAIQDAFGIPATPFWEAANKLHELELVDMYEDEVVRVSDQVLATYLFYLAFFKERIIDFSILLNRFFPDFRHHILDATNPVLSAFDSQSIMETMRRQVDKIWNVKEVKGDEDFLFYLIDAFWFLKQTDALLYIRKHIDALKINALELHSLEYKADSNIQSPSILSILRSFKHTDEGNFEMALELLFNYATKQPQTLPQILYLLVDDFGFTHRSYLRGYSVQRTVIELLWRRTEEGTNEFFSKLFLHVAEPYLHTRFHASESKGDDSVAFIKFELAHGPEICDLRRSIWNRVIQLYQTSQREAATELISRYSNSGYYLSVNPIIADDASILLLFVDSHMNPNSYRHCCIVQRYLDLLDNRALTYPAYLRNLFSNATYESGKLILSEGTERRNLGIGIEEFRQRKLRLIKEHFANYSLLDYKRFIEQCKEIKKGLQGAHQEYQLHDGIVTVLSSLAEHNPTLYNDILRHYLSEGDPLKINCYSLVDRLVKTYGLKNTYELIDVHDYPTKRRWLFDFYQCIPVEEIARKHVDQLYALYNAANSEEIPYYFDYLLKYRSFDERIVARVTRIILDKAQANQEYAHTLSSLFYSNNDTNSGLTEYFEKDIEVLKNAYIAILATDRHEDHDGQSFGRILDIDPDFAIEYIDEIYKLDKHPTRYSDTRDYSFLWKRDNSVQLMTRVIERIYYNEQKQISLRSTYPAVLFGIGEEGQHNPATREKQDEFLNDVIKHRFEILDFMRFVFALIAQFVPERKRQFVKVFLQHNKRFEDFQALPLEPHVSSWSGSAVPTLQGQAEYLESLLPFLNSVELLQHRQYIEQTIQRIRSEIEWEKKRDFMGD